MFFENIDQLLQDKYLPIETGYRRLPDGQMYIAVLTRMVGCKVRWLNMWLKNHAQHELKDRQLLTFLKEAANKEISNLDINDEFQGKYVMDKIIAKSQFISEDPKKYLNVAKLKERGIQVFMCGYTLSPNGDITDHTFQIVRNTSYGCEMRSYYWVNSCTDKEAQNRIEHCITDIGNLADFMKITIENYKKQHNKPNIVCKFCFSDDVVKNGMRKGGQYWKCKSCGRQFVNNSALPYMRYPYYIIAKAVNDHFYHGKSINDIKKDILECLNVEPSTSTMYYWLKKLTDITLR